MPCAAIDWALPSHSLVMKLCLYFSFKLVLELGYKRGELCPLVTMNQKENRIPLWALLCKLWHLSFFLSQKKFILSLGCVGNVLSRWYCSVACSEPLAFISLLFTVLVISRRLFPYFMAPPHTAVIEASILSWCCAWVICCLGSSFGWHCDITVENARFKQDDFSWVSHDTALWHNQISCFLDHPFDTFSGSCDLAVAS